MLNNSAGGAEGLAYVIFFTITLMMTSVETSAMLFQAQVGNR